MLGLCVIGAHEPCFSVSHFFSKNDDTYKSQYEKFSSLLSGLKAQVEEAERNIKGGEQPMNEFENEEVVNPTPEVEPEVKEQAEEIMSQLGIPVSVVINMLYKQIIMKKAIPFSLSVSSVPVTLDEMDSTTFNSVMINGLEQAKNGNSKDANDVFSALHKELLNG